MPVCQMDGCNIIIVIQYSCVLFQCHTVSQYFDFTDCSFYLCVSSADNGIETKQNEIIKYTDGKKSAHFYSAPC